MLYVLTLDVENKDSFMVHENNHFDCPVLSGLSDKYNSRVLGCVFFNNSVKCYGYIYYVVKIITFGLPITKTIIYEKTNVTIFSSVIILFHDV